MSGDPGGAPLVVRHPDAEAFLDRAGPWLLEREAENNLVIAIATDLAAGRTEGWRPPFFLATVEDGGEVVGCAFRTPPHKVGLTAMPAGAEVLVAKEVAGIYPDLPAVMGPRESARRFARAWAEIRGVDFERGMRLRIHLAREVDPPGGAPEGRMRPAKPEEHDLLVAWWEGFGRDAGVGLGPAAPQVRRLTETGDLVVWDVGGGAVSMAAAVGRTPSGTRVGAVYTPPERRRLGYATALVAALTERELEERDHCFLYTDLANPTSNAIYRRIGYRPVADVVDYLFGEG